MTDYKIQRSINKVSAFAEHYGMSKDRIDQEIVGRLFGGDSDPLEAFIDGVHYRRRPGEEAHTFIDRVNADVIKRREPRLAYAQEGTYGQQVCGEVHAYFEDPELFVAASSFDIDLIWSMAKEAEVAGIKVVKEPDESAEMFRTRVEALIERMDGGLQ